MIHLLVFLDIHGILRSLPQREAFNILSLFILVLQSRLFASIECDRETISCMIPVDTSHHLNNVSKAFILICGIFLDCWFLLLLILDSKRQRLSITSVSSLPFLMLFAEPVIISWVFFTFNLPHFSPLYSSIFIPRVCRKFVFQLSEQCYQQSTNYR